MFRALNACDGWRRTLLLASAALLIPALALGQDDGGDDGGDNGNGNNDGGTTTIINAGSAVGGIAIDPSGVLSNADVDATGELRKIRHEMLSQVPSDLDKPSELRKISLRQLEAAIDEHVKAGTPLPEEILLLGGLQRLKYVLVYPEQQDIVLVGYAEGWKVDEHGDIVGKTTGRPVMQLDDLLVALRSAVAAPGVVSCSIDPTPEGLQRMRELTSRLRTIGNPKQTIAAIEETLGPQVITVSGVAGSSRLARVLVAADYRMKRIAMDFEKAPVAGLPSFMEMVAASGATPTNMLPRWWLEPSYDPLLRDAEGLAFELRGGNVKCLTEEDFITASGAVGHTGQANKTAQKWADLLTEKYPELALREPIFGELQNVMDLLIVAALVVKENLPAKAGYDFPLLLQAGPLTTVSLEAPKNVDSKATVLKKGRNWIISASGGVQINPYQFVEKMEESPEVAAARAEVKPQSTRWWWD